MKRADIKANKLHNNMLRAKAGVHKICYKSIEEEMVNRASQGNQRELITSGTWQLNWVLKDG